MIFGVKNECDETYVEGNYWDLSMHGSVDMQFKTFAGKGELRLPRPPGKEVTDSEEEDYCACVETEKLCLFKTFEIIQLRTYQRLVIRAIKHIIP